MRKGSAARKVAVEDDLFDRIGAFLALQGLSPEPEHYSFAYAALVDPQGPIATAIARLGDTGVRLSRQDIERLGGTVSTALPPVRKRRHAVAADERSDSADRLVAETRSQVEGFADVMRAVHNETRTFGADLAASAAAITRAPQIAGIDEIARITGAMMARVRTTEIRLAQATEETEALRAKLAEAQDSARRDVLTGLPNRRAFDEAFAARDPAKGPWCLAVADIDRFKRVNDDHGHAVGDRVLSAIGQALAEECVGQLVVRHGGEEFAVLTHGMDLTAAATLLDAARATVAAKRFRSRESGLPLGQITLSAGITAVQPEEQAEDAFARADRLLYTAKTGGRDRISAG